MTLFEAWKKGEHMVHVGGNFRLVVTDVSPHFQVLNNAHAREHAAPLGHHGQALMHQIPSPLPPNAASQVIDFAHTWQQPGDGLHGAGLARPVGANQADQLARMHLQIDALDGLNAAIGDLQARDLKQCGVGHAGCPVGLPALATAP